MFRKTALALASATVVATATIPTAASAYCNDWRHRHRSGVGVTTAGPYHAYAYGPRCYVTKKWVHTRWGLRKIHVRHCR